MHNKIGLIYAFSAYTLWGIIPLFWKQLDHVDSVEIVMHRMVWSCVLVTMLILLSRQWASFRPLLSQPKIMLRLLLASVLISVNWAVFIWAVNNDRLIETSLGYFMNPLISVALGVILFSEVLRLGQWLSLLVAGIGVVYLFATHGSFPWISLVLALSFSLYSAVKKSISVPATHGMAIETLCFFVPALIYLVYIEWQGSGQFFEGSSNSWMLILGGLFTLIPLLLFAAAAKRISLTALGMMQYIGPTLQLVCGVLIYQEPFGSQKMIAFGFIWFALAIFSADQLYDRRRRKSAERRAV